MAGERQLQRLGQEDYLFTVKDNQPALRADIALAFGDASPLCFLVAAA